MIKFFCHHGIIALLSIRKMIRNKHYNNIQNIVMIMKISRVM